MTERQDPADRIAGRRSDPDARAGSADDLALALERKRAGARAALLAPERRRRRQQSTIDPGDAAGRDGDGPAGDSEGEPASARLRWTPQLIGALAGSAVLIVLLVVLATYHPSHPRGRAAVPVRPVTPARIATTPIATTTTPRPVARTTAREPVATTAAPPPVPATAQATVVRGRLAVAQRLDLGAAAGGLVVTPASDAWVSVPARNVVVEVPVSGPIRTFGSIPAPGPLVAGSAGVWVTLPGSHAVALLAGGHLGGRVALPGRPVAIALDARGRSAWVADTSGAISRVGGGSPLSTHISPAATSVAVGEPNWVWAANGSLVRVSPAGRGARTFAVGAGAIAVSVNQGIWTAHADGLVTRFDPRPSHTRVIAHITAPAPLSGIAAREGSSFVWAISTSARTLYEIAVAHPRVVGMVRFASPPTDVAVTHLGVWVTTASGSMIRIQR